MCDAFSEKLLFSLARLDETIVNLGRDGLKFMGYFV